MLRLSMRANLATLVSTISGIYCVHDKWLWRHLAKTLQRDTFRPSKVNEFVLDA